MGKQLLFALASTALYLAGAIPYVLGILKKEVLPHPFSFGTWLILTGINVGILYQTNAGWSLLPAIVQIASLVFYTVGGIMIFRQIKVNWFDYLCLAMAAGSMAAWFFASNETAAMLTAIIDLIAFLPTIKKGWIQPHTEYVFPWVTAAVFPVFLMLAAPELNPATMAFWLYLVAANGAFSAVLWWRKGRLAVEEN